MRNFDGGTLSKAAEIAYPLQRLSVLLASFWPFYASRDIQSLKLPPECVQEACVGLAILLLTMVLCEGQKGKGLCGHTSPDAKRYGAG